MDQFTDRPTSETERQQAANHRFCHQHGGYSVTARTIRVIPREAAAPLFYGACLTCRNMYGLEPLAADSPQAAFVDHVDLCPDCLSRTDGDACELGTELRRAAFAEARAES